jgi:glycosyltransferase involved in cell wall biosynthesis
LVSIAHIITSLDVGGAESSLYTLLTNGLEGPFRNHVISLMGPGHYGQLLENAGISLSCLHMNRGRPSLRSIKSLRAIIRACSPQLVQGWLTHGNLASTFARFLFEPRAALGWNIRWTLEGLSHASASTRLLTYIGSRLSSMPDVIIYNSQRSLRQHADIGYKNARAYHLPNGFNTDLWKPSSSLREEARAELGLSNKHIVIGFVGRGHPEKDPATLFHAFAKVHSSHPHVKLVAVGRGLDRFGPLSRNVILLGQRYDIPRLMQAFDILCLSSSVEGFPNVLGESMATGVPCVATDVGDARMIIGNTGWLVPPRDSYCLARALIEAISSTPEELRKRGLLARDRIKVHFSVSCMVANYISLYDDLISEQG